MKKHKSVVAILLAVMMIFTMMPMMAFADTNPPASKIVSWDRPLYATATGDNNIVFPTERNMDGNGLITATAKDKVEDVVGGETWKAPSDAVATYYDLEGATFTYPGATEEKAIDGTTWTRDQFDRLVKGQIALNVTLVEPTYTKNYQDSIKENPRYQAAKVQVPVSISAKEEGNTKTKTGTATFGAWTLTLNDFDFDATSTADQTVKLSVKSILPADNTETDGIHAADLNGTVKEATITVQGKAKTPADAEFYLDKVGGAALTDGYYDGKAHTVVVDETPGYTWSYQVRNAQGKFEDVSAVTITDVQTTPIAFKAFYTDSKGVKTQKGSVMSLNLKSLDKVARDVTISWDEKASANDSYYDYYEDEDGNAHEYFVGNYLYLVDGTKYNAADYIATVAKEVPAGSGEKAKDAAVRVALNDAAKNALAANEAQLKDFFNTYYELKDVTTKRAAANDQVVFTIARKTLSEAEEKAAEEKFAQLVANFGENGIKVVSDTATIQLNADKIDYEIEFTKAPEGAKVIHIKKAKKLKKDKSFSVKAVSNKGVAVQYKLINANSKIKINKTTGKITLKKGLKKGTYKFKVKAYVPGYSLNNYEVQNIVVKIKK